MTINVLLNNKPNRKGLYCVFIRVTHKRKHYANSSEIYVKKHEFDKAAKYGYWIVKHLDRDRLNQVLKDKIVKVEQTYQRAEEVTPQRALIADSFFAFGEQWIEKFNNEKNKGTYDIYVSKFSKLKEYAGDKLKFSDITIKFLRDYGIHLKTKHGNAVNTVGVDLKKIRATIRQAVRENVVEFEKNPFNNFMIEHERTTKEKLTIKEIDTLRNVKLLHNYQIIARDIFLLQLNLMGERIGSVLKLKCNQINKDFATYQMGKGGKTKNVQLTTEAKKIIKKYKSTGVYLFHYLENTKDIYTKIKSSTSLINQALKEIASIAKIKKNLSTHISRHSFTGLAIEAGTDMRTLQGMLNHTSIKTTEDYAGDIADIKGNEALKKIFKSK